MNVSFNGEIKETSKQILSDFLKEIDLISKNGIAVAVNNTIIAKPDWYSKELKENDSILIITATQGG